VAEQSSDKIEGIALYYTAYSTWKGRMLFLEDLVVTETLRGTGIGKQLFDAVVAEARRTGANRMKWQVLNWNEPAIGFYKRIGANLDPEWLNGNLTAEQLAAYVCNPAVEALVRV
jgi:GNAT superfamily N-acetyltransferase